jgi:GntR family histidine utilization transcriptional repressor
VIREPTLHQRIRNDISERILSGAWPPGHRVPSEHLLMAEYGCSRMTVSKALAPLAESGLIVRRRRAGSFVARPKIHSVVLDIPDISAEVNARGEAYGYALHGATRRAAREPDRKALDLDRPVQVLALRCLHTAAGRPFAYEERLINLDAAPEAADVDFAETPPGGWLLSHVPWTEAEHRISAANATASVARVLGLQPGAACLILERRTWRGDDKITFVRMSFPGDAYDLVARFTPTGATG